MLPNTKINEADDLDEHSARRLFAWNLRRRRESQHLRQSDVASEAGLSPSSLSQIEHGRQGLSLDLADRLARAVKSRLRDLLKPRGAKVERKEEDIVVHVGPDGMTAEKADTVALTVAAHLRHMLRKRRRTEH